MRIALYRCLYGADFVQESIRSILSRVDRVYVVLADRPWGTSVGIEWKGQWVSWPKPFDDIRERILDLHESSIEIVDHYFPTPNRQYEFLLDHVLPNTIDEVIVMEPDWVFSDSEASRVVSLWESAGKPYASTRQVELWRTPAWRIPERLGRTTPMLFRTADSTWRTSFPVPLDAICHNLGFCFSDETMLWKHLTGLAFSKEIGDCIPDPDWYEKKWLGWNSIGNNFNLEMTKTLEHIIPYAEPYDVTFLPTSIRRRYGL